MPIYPRCAGKSRVRGSWDRKCWQGCCWYPCGKYVPLKLSVSDRYCWAVPQGYQPPGDQVKIAVYGATGMVGSQIVNGSLTRGHHVTAISRKGADVAGTQSRSADLADARTFAEISETHDAVVLATGPSRTGGDHNEWLSAMKAAYASAGDTRLLIVGGAGALEVDGVRLVDTPGFPEAYKAEALTLAAAYEAVNDSP